MLIRVPRFVVKIGLLALPTLVFAGPLTPPYPITTPEQLRDSLLCKFLAWFYTFAIIIGIIFVILTAYKYITAGGEAEKVKSAHKTLIYAIIGFAVAILARGVPLIVANLIGGVAAGTTDQACQFSP